MRKETNLAPQVEYLEEELRVTRDGVLVMLLHVDIAHLAHHSRLSISINQSINQSFNHPARILEPSKLIVTSLRFRKSPC